MPKTKSVKDKKETAQKNSLDGYPLLVSTLLRNRGVTSKKEADAFLNPSFEALSDPFTMHDMGKAVDRIIAAIEADERIVIYADYDADGIPGSVVLYDFLHMLGYDNFGVYIPHRHKEGYGFHEDAITELVNQNVDLVITVDVGINAGDSVAYAEERGVDVIVTDHHVPGEEIPRAYAVVNPKLGTYHDTMLCGAGVAFRLVQACILELEKREHQLVDMMHAGWEKWLLDMVGIATVADCVPLVNENRIFAHFGLLVLRKSRRLGLQSLLRDAYVPQQHMVEDDISFTIAPRINAASRMAHPLDAFTALAARQPADAKHASKHLVKINNERKLLVAHIMKQVKKTLAKREIREVIVIGDPDWSTGVLGLVASKISEEFDRPSFVWTAEEGDVIRGSCRSDGSANVLDVMNEVQDDYLLEFGGHAEAGGFTAVHEKIHYLEDEIIEAYQRIGIEKKKNKEQYMIDMELTLDQVNQKNYSDIRHCAPFGIGNPKPIFKFTDVTVVDVRLFGKGKEHIEVILEDETRQGIKAISFFTTTEDYPMPIKKGASITLLAHFDMSYFRGRKELRLRIVDVT